MIAAPDASDQPSASSRPRGRRIARAVLSVPFVALGALVLGGLTSPAQGLLPDVLASFANSAGGWTILTVVLVAATRSRPAMSAVLGVVAFVSLVEGYRLVSDWRGIEFGDPFTGIWTVVAIVTGPIIGFCVGLIQFATPGWRLLATTPIVAVLTGEGVYGLLYISETTSPVYWAGQALLGVVLFVAVVLRARPRALLVVGAAGLAALGCALFVVGFTALGGV